MTGFAFRIGVVGHRNIATEQIAVLEVELAKQLQMLSDLLGNSSKGDGVTSAIPIVVLSALAEGADRLFARAALDLFGKRICLVAVLPMAADEYEKDFPNSVDEFRDLVSQCSQVLVVEQKANETREAQYRRSWELICAQSNLLFALWDLKTGQIAGTAECIRTRCFSAAQTQLGEAYMAGPIIVIPTARAAEQVGETDPLVAHLKRIGVVGSNPIATTTSAEALSSHTAWIKEYAAVALAVSESRTAPLPLLTDTFGAAEITAKKQRQSINSSLKFMAIGFYVLAIALIFAGNLLPNAPVHFLASALTVIAVICWARMRNRGEYRIFVGARVLAEAARAQLALNRMGIARRAVDLLRYRSGAVSTTIRELLRSLGEPQPHQKGRYENCAGWLDEQIDYYTGSALARQSQFAQREKIRINILCIGNAAVAIAIVVAQVITWLLQVPIPRTAMSVGIAIAISLSISGVLMGLHTQQMQLREQSESFTRMHSILLTFKDWMSAADKTPNYLNEQQRIDAAQWVLSQALSEHEDWCLRQRGGVV
jgi:hypothetical protein